ncbi:MAG: PHP domain-containing protein [Candidatus Bilamarchaeaceae archaeon]
MKLDFHVHTGYSPDSMNEPKDIARLAKRFGVVPAITDHNSVKAHKEFRRGTFIPGEEIRTDLGDLIALFISEEIPKRTPYEEALELIKEQGGVSYVPHMYDTARDGVGVRNERFVKKADIVEVFNARCLRSEYNEKAFLFAKMNKKLMGAGSDSHTLQEFGRTYVEVPDFDMDEPKELLKALENGRIIGEKVSIFLKPVPTFIKLAKKIISKNREGEAKTGKDK